MSLESRSRTAKFSDRVATVMVAQRWPLAIIAVVILATAWPLSWRLEMDRTIDQMFAPQDPTLLAYQELQTAFGGNAALLFVYHDPELLTATGLERANELSGKIAEVSGVRGVLSVSQLNEVLGVIRPGGLLTGLSSDTPPLLRKDDVVSRAFERLFVGYTHAESGEESAIVTLLEPADPNLGYGEVVKAMRRLTHDLPSGMSNAVLVGEPVLLSEGFDLIERDGTRLAIWTIALLSPLVLFLLRGVRWVMLQVIVIGWAVTVTRATMLLIGIRLSLVSSILTAICTVIAVTSVIHLGTAWQRRRARGDATDISALRSVALVMPAIFWACATDAAGFLSLIGSAVAPIRDFAIMMGVASLSVWGALALCSPLLMSLGTSDRFQFKLPAVAVIERTIRRWSVSLAVLMMRYRTWVLLASALLTVATIVGIGRLQIETSFLKNFRGDSEIALSYDRVEGALQGAGVWDVVLDAPDVLTDDYLERVRALEKRLRGIEVEGAKLTKVLSMADADRIASAVPLLKLATPTFRLTGMRAAIPAFSDALLVPAGQPQRKLRIMLRSREHLSAEIKMELIAQVETIVREETSTPAWLASFPKNQTARPGRVTGYYVMIARLVSQILGDQWRCLGWAAALVWLLLIMATRSLRLATLALIPNLLPVLGVLGVLGWIGEPMNMGAAMIAAVSVGLSIDGSVHFLAAYQRKKQRDRTDRDAAIYAQHGVGLPVVLATVALVIGFVGLGSSEFVPTATFGVLTAVALLLGTIVNLTLLPIMVSLGSKPE